MDLDSQGLKLCEAIQTRPRTPHINGNRFVALVLLANSAEKDSHTFVDQAVQLGAMSVVWLPAAISAIQETVLKSVRLRAMAEDVHKLVSTNKVRELFMS